MACNPALCAGPDGVAAPVPFAGEQFLLSRDGIEFELDGLECVPAQQLLAPPTWLTAAVPRAGAAAKGSLLGRRCLSRQGCI